LETKDAMSGLSWSRRDVPPRRDQHGLPNAEIEGLNLRVMCGDKEIRYGEQYR
jgi:hypothetical protein